MSAWTKSQWVVGVGSGLVVAAILAVSTIGKE